MFALDASQPATSDKPKTILDKVASAVQGKAYKQAAGTVIETASFKQTWLHEQHSGDVVAPVLPEAQPQTVQSLMPQGEEVEVADGTAIANKKVDINVIEFVMVVKMKDKDGVEQVQLPSGAIFESLVGKASWQLMDEKAEYCLVVDTVVVNDDGIGILGVNYQDFDGAERFRSILRGYSTTNMGVETYPMSDMLKRYALFFSTSITIPLTTG
jgi:hypothetical protein